VIQEFQKTAGPSVRKKMGFFKTALRYFNLMLAWRYFQQPEKTDQETPSL
jgi:hypothetical protein